MGIGKEFQININKKYTVCDCNLEKLPKEFLVFLPDIAYPSKLPHNPVKDGYFSLPLVFTTSYILPGASS